MKTELVRVSLAELRSPLVSVLVEQGADALVQGAPVRLVREQREEVRPVGRGQADLRSFSLCRREGRGSYANTPISYGKIHFYNT